MLNSVGTQSLDTPRLLLRRFQRGDGKSAFRNWCGDAAVTTYLKWTAHPYPLATEQVVNRWIREYHDPLCFHWAITRREYGDVIGGIGLTVWDAADERGAPPSGAGALAGRQRLRCCALGLRRWAFTVSRPSVPRKIRPPSDCSPPSAFRRRASTGRSAALGTAVLWTAAVLPCWPLNIGARSALSGDFPGGAGASLF